MKSMQDKKEAKLDKIRRKIIAELLGRQAWVRNEECNTKSMHAAVLSSGPDSAAVKQYHKRSSKMSGEIAKIDIRVDKLLEQYKLVTEGKA